PNTATSSRRSPSRRRTLDRGRSCPRSITTALRCCSASTPRSVSRSAPRARRRPRATCRSDARRRRGTAGASRGSPRGGGEGSAGRWCVGSSLSRRLVLAEFLNPPLVLVDRLLNSGYLVHERRPRRAKLRDALVVGLMPHEVRAT